MLDSETKRRIDTARDILVGKVPDPKSQVEQITIALIYKFMDDMDAESEELGGRRKFFTGDFARYGWAKLMRSGLGGHETLNLYAEAIARMPENPGIPLLFREIFKNAFLPYRDPETLRSFLKVIDEFSYDHSERLGDAFEYLLSVLGSQGDAGQFRTPRHIIDFIVAVVDPKKNETILDPACGTAGFLISAYKHIIKANTSKDGVCSLTPDERAKLAQGIRGYDISPDMVRLSLVNLYLHGFTDPHIVEYDTLTSQERWNETADAILANPPFMSPKGGIKPHTRFSVQSKRSEVLFVDYMSEHLNANGRAGIIVPEGIIFQSQGAYAELRKLLVENSLVAVVSLPAGVFNPYSGVKTSILILDKFLARQSGSIGFFKVENDGFGLGAQRREIAKNDLPQVQTELRAYLEALRSNRATDELTLNYGLIAPKEKIAENGDYNLSVERFRQGNAGFSRFSFVELGAITLGKPQYGSGASKVEYNGNVRYVRITDLTERGTLKEADPVSPSTLEEDCFLQYDDLLIARSGSVGRTYIHSEKSGTFQFAGYLIRFRIDPARAVPRYVFQITQSPYWYDWIARQSKTGTISNINAQEYSSFRLPLPPLDVQKEIVEEIEGYQKVIDGARAVLDNYRPHIPIHPDWPRRELGTIAENLDSRRVPITKGDRKEGPFPYYGASGIVDYVADYIFDEDILLISEDGANLLARSTPIAFSVSGKCWVNNHAHVLKFAHRATQKFVEVHLNSISIEEFVNGAAQPKLTQQALNRIPIPIPNDVSTQQAIVAEIETEQSLVAANRELIARFEKKIQATLARIWGEDEPLATED